MCAITPFNRPLNQVVVKLAPAIAANNSVILKPSERTPLSAVKFVKCLIQNGLPPRMVSVVTGRPEEIGDVLVTCPEIDMVTFTGSRAVGEHIARKVGMIKTAFELGDSGALVVLKDADLEAALEAAAAGAFGSCGQSCRGVKRILVEEGIADIFVGKLKAAAERIRTGNPWSEDTDIGVLISEDAARTVEGRIQEAVKQGARLVCGGERSGAEVRPAVLDHVDRNSPIVKEETFGPCAPVIRIRDVEDAVECVNGTAYGLQAGIFTNSLKDVLYAASELDVGAVIVNNGPQFDSPAIPFGGVKKSGLGREGAKYAIQEMTRVKTIVF